MPRGGLLTVGQAKQVDHIAFRVRQELNVSPRWFKFPKAGKRFDFYVSCGTCKTPEERFDYAKHALVFLVTHIGHRTRIDTFERDRTAREDRIRPDKRRT